MLSGSDFFYVNYRDYTGWRRWEDAEKYSYVSGCGHRHVQHLRRLQPGHHIWVYVPRNGYMGVASVLAGAVPSDSFRVQTPSGERSILDVIPNKEMAAHHEVGNQSECEHYVAVQWLQTLPSLNEAIYAKRPLFSSRLVVCQPKVPDWHKTVTLLESRFPKWNSCAG